METQNLKDFKQQAEKCIGAFQKDLGRVRTGRANLNLLDNVRVDYYGQPTPLNQVAAVSVADARMIVIKPWEKKLITEIERAINNAQLGLTPQTDGELVRLVIPALTEERRKDLVKQVKKASEEARVAVRNVRRDVNEMVKLQQDEGTLTEDDATRELKAIQDATDASMKKIDELVAGKEKEIFEK